MFQGWAADNGFATRSRNDAATLGECGFLQQLHCCMREGWSLADGFAPSDLGGRLLALAKLIDAMN